MFFRNTLVAHKWTENPLFMRFTVLEEIIPDRISDLIKPLKFGIFKGFLCVAVFYFDSKAASNLRFISMDFS